MAAEASAKSPQSVDDLYGVICRWHIPLFLFAIIRGIPSTVNIMSMVFIAPHQDFVCITPEGWTAVDNQCYMKPQSEQALLITAKALTNHDQMGDPMEFENTTDVLVPCTKWNFDHSVYAGTTIVEEWGLVCERRWLISSSQSLFLGGVMLGTILFSHVSDWFGRKRASLVSLLWASTTGFLMAFAPSIAWFNVLRFLTAVGTSGYADVAHILILESVSPDKRYIVTMTVGIGWSIGMILVPIQAHFLPNWRSMLIGVPLPVLLLLVLWFCMDESARWLIGAGRYTEARQALLRLTHSRGDLEDRHVDELLDAIKLQHQQGELKTKPTIADLFSREYRKSTIIFCATMLVSYLLWYHVTVSTAGVGTNPYIAFATAATFELPGKAMNVLFIRFVRRRRAATLAFGVASVLTAAYGVLPVGLAWLRLGCLIMCKLCIAVQGAVHRVQISELYPSVIRALSTGFIITIGSFGSVLAPFLDDVGYLTFEWVPMVFIALLCSLSCVAVLSLPETFEDVLQDGMTSNSSQPRSRGQSTGSPTPTAISASHSKPPDGQNERLRSLSGTDNKAMELSG